MQVEGAMNFKMEKHPADPILICVSVNSGDKELKLGEFHVAAAEVFRLVLERVVKAGGCAGDKMQQIIWLLQRASAAMHELHVFDFVSSQIKP